MPPKPSLVELRWGRFYLSAAEIGLLLDVSAATIRDHLYDNEGRKVVWTDDNRPADVWLVWMGKRIRAEANHNGHLTFNAAEANDVFSGGRRLHPSVYPGLG